MFAQVIGANGSLLTVDLGVGGKVSGLAMSSYRCFLLGADCNRWAYSDGFSQSFMDILKQQVQSRKEMAMEGNQPRQGPPTSTEEENTSKVSMLLKEHNVTLFGEKPLGVGEFGSVWKGWFGNGFAAVKVIDRGKL